MVFKIKGYVANDDNTVNTTDRLNLGHVTFVAKPGHSLHILSCGTSG